MNRKDIFMSGFKSKIGYLFNYKDLAEFEAIIDFYEKEYKKQNEVIYKVNKLLRQEHDDMTTKFHYDIVGLIDELLDILKEVSE